LVQQFEFCRLALSALSPAPVWSPLLSAPKQSLVKKCQ
jgi:hypothetical protein